MQTHIVSSLTDSLIEGRSWNVQSIFGEIQISCQHSDTCGRKRKHINLVQEIGQQRISYVYPTCSDVHQSLTQLGYSGGTHSQPGTAFCNRMLKRMRHLILDCDINIHSYCDHLHRRSITNGICHADKDVYDNLRTFYGSYTAQQNAIEAFSLNPIEPTRTSCPACVHNVDKTVTLTVDGNFSCKCKKSQSKNPRPSFWKNGISRLSKFVGGKLNFY